MNRLITCAIVSVALTAACLAQSTQYQPANIAPAPANAPQQPTYSLYGPSNPWYSSPGAATAPQNTAPTQAYDAPSVDPANPWNPTAAPPAHGVASGGQQSGFGSAGASGAQFGGFGSAASSSFGNELPAYVGGIRYQSVGYAQSGATANAAAISGGIAFGSFPGPGQSGFGTLAVGAAPTGVGALSPFQLVAPPSGQSAVSLQYGYAAGGAFDNVFPSFSGVGPLGGLGGVGGFSGVSGVSGSGVINAPGGQWGGFTTPNSIAPGPMSGSPSVPGAADQYGRLRGYDGWGRSGGYFRRD